MAQGIFLQRRIALAAGIGVAAGAVGAAAASRWLRIRRQRLSKHSSALLTEDVDQVRSNVWVVMNPSKHEDPALFRQQVEEAAARHGITTINWAETTPEDPGTGQAIAAQRKGATLVIAAGGDGTVRAVAAGMANSGVRMGIIPVGTGNIFARNIHLPVDDLDETVAIAVGAHYRRVDLGWLRCTDMVSSLGMPAEGGLVCAHYADGHPSGAPNPAEDEYSYIVVSGIGYDGQAMADTDPGLKKKIGWVAYMISGIQALRAPRLDAHIRIWPHGEDGPVEESRGRARTIMFANVGELLFMTLAPEAAMDDAKFDVIGVDVTAGLIGWITVGWRFLAHGLRIPALKLPFTPSRVGLRQAQRAALTIAQPAVVEVDGDAIGEATGVEVRLDPHALLISAPDVLLSS